MPDGAGMPLLEVLEDIKLWIALAIVFALVFGFDSPDASTIMMVALILQMSVALDGIRFQRSDFATYRVPIVVNLLCCFGICTGFTLLTGLFFIDDRALWTGWVMLSAVPCAISVVPSALFLRADPKLSVLSLIVIYVVAIALTPLMTHALIGNSVDPMEVLRYILMFILIPFIITVPLKRLHLKSRPKTLFINVMMFVLVFAGLGSRQEFVFGEPTVVLALVVACMFRIFLVSTVLVLAMRRMHVNRDNGLNYTSFSYWKNSGMAASMTMSLFAATMPEAVLPCVVSLIVEAVWFAILTKYIDRMWPPAVYIDDLLTEEAELPSKNRGFRDTPPSL